MELPGAEFHGKGIVMYKSTRRTLGVFVAASLFVPFMAAAKGVGQTAAVGQNAAATTVQINTMQEQINALQKQLDALRAAQRSTSSAATDGSASQQLAEGSVTSSASAGLASGKNVLVAKAKPKPPVAVKVLKPKAIVVTPEHKKTMAELLGTYKFGMSKTEVLAQLTKQIDEQYAEKIKETTDVYVQDGLRKEKKADIARITKTYIEFNGKKGGWDVSMIEDEFAHNTGESMLEQWENQNGKNQRRFFFFVDSKLYKMLVLIDTSILPADKRNFETFQVAMFGRYGEGEVEPGRIKWQAGDFNVTAVDKLKSYDALCLTISDPAVTKALEVTRTAKAVAKQGPSAITRAVLDNGDEKIDINANSNAANAVINQK